MVKFTCWLKYNIDIPL